jgi:MFS family permease
MVGFLLCMFSLANAIGLVYLDKKAEEQDPEGERAQLAEDEKFQWSDIYSFNSSFWLLTGSCVVTYMSVFPYIQISSDLLQTKYSFDTKTAGYLFGIPYIISAVSSPFLGLAIDKIGKRAFLICLSSAILILAYGTSMMMPGCYKCYNELYPLVLTGIGYSIYAAAIWGSIPYVVEPNTVGTAFGMATAFQNIGLCIAPTFVGWIKDNTKQIDHGYFWVNVFFVFVNIIGLVLNVTLYYIDIKKNGGVLDKVQSLNEEEN